MSRPQLAHVNRQVKKVIAQALVLPGADNLLEWGCGYDTIIPYLPSGKNWVGADIDPRVVQYHTQKNRICHLTGNSSSAAWQNGHQFDAIAAVFVLHFGISDFDVESIVRLLKPSGIFLANVYHRNARSRAALKQRFESRGLTIKAVPDKDNLCSEHVYWVGSRQSGDRLIEIAASL
jgi:SAM-dependent methyltransferase